MIPYSQVRAAKRRQVEGMIAATPSGARLMRSSANGGGSLVLTVRTGEPKKFREMRMGGFDPKTELEALVALPLGAKKPDPEKEFIAIEDLSGDWKNYSLTSVTALEGTSCFILGLASRNTAPTSARPPRPY